MRIQPKIEAKLQMFVMFVKKRQQLNWLLKNKKKKL